MIMATRCMIPCYITFGREGYTASGSLCGTLCAKPEVFPKEIHFLYSFLKVRTINNAKCPDYHIADLLEAN